MRYHDDSGSSTLIWREERRRELRLALFIRVRKVRGTFQLMQAFFNTVIISRESNKEWSVTILTSS